MTHDIDNPQSPGTLTALRGLPGCGKTSYARSRLDTVRVSRDDTRLQLHGRIGPARTGHEERQVTLAVNASIRALVAAGYDVIADQTCLEDAHLAELRGIAAELGARFVVADFRGVPLAACVAGDAGRAGCHLLGAEKIARMHADHVAGRPDIPTPDPGSPRLPVITEDGYPVPDRVVLRPALVAIG